MKMKLYLLTAVMSLMAGQVLASEGAAEAAEEVAAPGGPVVKLPPLPATPPSSKTRPLPPTPPKSGTRALPLPPTPGAKVGATKSAATEVVVTESGQEDKVRFWNATIADAIKTFKTPTESKFAKRISGFLDLGDAFKSLVYFTPEERRGPLRKRIEEARELLLDAVTQGVIDNKELDRNLEDLATAEKNLSAPVAAEAKKVVKREVGPEQKRRMWSETIKADIARYRSSDSKITKQYAINIIGENFKKLAYFTPKDQYGQLRKQLDEARQLLREALSQGIITNKESDENTKELDAVEKDIR